MKVLLLHQAYPSQFGSLAAALAARGDEVLALTTLDTVPPDQAAVTVMRYRPNTAPTEGVHPWVVGLECGIILGNAVFQVARTLKAQGFTPDVVIAHPNWGESLFVKAVWPETKLGLYCELYADAKLNADFDLEFGAANDETPCRVLLDNALFELHLGLADAALSPTAWQAASFPPRWRSLIEIAHEGVDTERLAPNPVIRVDLGGGLVLTRADEVVTFSNRNLEPLRGWHIFMRSVPEILAARPGARVVIIGGDKPGYGASLEGTTWKQKLIDEVRPRLNDDAWSQIHFVGRLPFDQYQALLQLSSVHVYLTYPYVLSWSLIEAMSAGCAIVASDVAPVREVITHGENGRLVDFFDIFGLAQEVSRLLDEPAARAALGAAARARAVAEYDRKTVCLPKQIAWVDRLAAL